jgi:hypothetical protein
VISTLDMDWSLAFETIAAAMLALMLDQILGAF